MEPVLRFKADDGSDFPDWEEKTLGELCAPLTYGMNAAATRFDGENRYIRITDIDDETHAYLSDDVVSPEGKLDDKYIVGNGDILLARTGASTGKSYLYHSKDGKLFYAGFLIKAHVLSSSDDYFVYSQTLTDKYWKWVKTTSMRSGQPGINATEYASYSFAVPSLPEQHKIADLLSTVDRVIAAQQAEVNAWEQRKKGVMQKLFSQ
ncbi:MAG: restriction endonuclease subunit S, partial [Bifidobacteriales bacterium]|nr:restriction endonuclease subunit S [Bifidobacteriales bacterium]